MLITERTAGDDFMMIKLVYSISITGISCSYIIAIGDLNKTLSFFYFNHLQLHSYNNIQGCSISQKEYSLEYIYKVFILFLYRETDELCNEIK